MFSADFISGPRSIYGVCRLHARVQLKTLSSLHQYTRCPRGKVLGGRGPQKPEAYQFNLDSTKKCFQGTQKSNVKTDRRYRKLHAKTVTMPQCSFLSLRRCISSRRMCKVQQLCCLEMFLSVIQVSCK